MNFEKQLYYAKTPAITIDIKLGFRETALVMEGCDTGSSVEELRGDYDYEYAITVKDHGLEKLYQLLGLPLGQKQLLIGSIAEKFNDYQCWSSFRTWLKEHDVHHESWTH